MPILTVHTVIMTFGKMRLSLSSLTGQQYILLKNPDQYLEEEEEEEEVWPSDASPPPPKKKKKKKKQQSGHEF